jgi:hypothetical protein
MAIEAKNVVAPFTAQHLEAICRVLADTDTGLTGSEIGYLLQDSRIVDTDPTLTKWKRLFNAFVGFQNEHKAWNCVVVFITRSMNPASYTDRPDVFRLRRDKLNAVLAFCGFHLLENGKVIHQDKASTIDQALPCNEPTDCVLL